jgi:potassium-transporting ATPase potassium-binding subunit
MKPVDYILVVVFFIVAIASAIPLGAYMAKVFSGARTFMSPVILPVERVIYSSAGIRPDDEMDWKRYLMSVLMFNALGFLFLYLLQAFQHSLPLNPRGLANVHPLLAFNTAVSFMTNTNWQAYSGESTLSYLVQMAGLTVQNFLSAATGSAVFIALARSVTRAETDRLGNFWVDLTRSILYVFLPFSLIFAVFLASQGVIQTFDPYREVTTLEGVSQFIPLGPVASQIAIKQLGTNGGGFFGVNGAHPFENPNALTNFFETIAIILLPMAYVFAYGRMVRARRHGAALFITMLLLLGAGLAAMLAGEHLPNPLYGNLPLLEGKELRFGQTASVLWGSLTTCASNGSVNAMHDSFTPVSGMVAMLNIMLGEIIFGGVGAGMYGMFMFVVVTVFIAGLMVGRTPEYLGKKIGKHEVQWAMAAIIIPSAMILVCSAMASVTSAGTAGLPNRGPHGLSEILYAFSSAAGNNGSAFAGLPADTTFYNIGTGISMLVGRFIVIAAAIAIAGSMASKKTIPESAGTFRTDGIMFVVLLVGVILIVGALTFFPALALGPIAEQMLFMKGMTF